MKHYDDQYKNTISRIVHEGIDVPDRTGVGVRKVFDVNISTDLACTEEGRMILPITTLRKVFPRTAWFELFWMLSGSTDANLLKEKNIHIWDGNTSREFLDSRGLRHLREGFGGKIYGHNFRAFNDKTDQLANVVNSLRTDPNGRRHYISLWNPSELDDAALPACHVSYQFVAIGDTLNLKFYQRSSDFILAGNVNFTFAAFFLQFMSSICGFKVGKLSHSIGDCHIYANHLEVAKELLDRDVIDHTATFANPFGVVSLETMSLDEIVERLFKDESWVPVKESLDYQSHPAIPREMLGMAV